MKDSAAEAAGFAALGLDERLLATLSALGYEEPTPIQCATIGPLLEGRDLVGQAATGTGKTAAFALPLIHRLMTSPRTTRGALTALVLVPTRELAMQVAEAIHRYGRAQNVRALAVYGGQGYEQQIRALHRGVDFVVATPGRALDHIGRGTMDLSKIATVILDEADEMLDMGFLEDIESILKATPPERQVVLFSATMPPRIASIAKRHLKDPIKISIAQKDVGAGEMPRVRQTAYIVAKAQKRAALSRLLDLEQPTSTIIFCRTRTDVDDLAEMLNAHGQRAEPLHGGMSQQQRDRVMVKLRAGRADLVIATDVAARGLDIEQLSHVVNYDVPSAPEAYVHRIGRVGRAGREGVAITLAEPREHRLLRNIEKITRQKIEVARIPTGADLQARYLEVTGANLRTAIQAADSERFRVVVEALATEFDIMEIALGAVKLAHESTHGAAASAKIEDILPPPPRNYEPQGDRGPGGPGGKKRERSRTPTEGTVRIFIGAGHTARVRPQDLVGAITGEAGINGKEIGAIDITPDFSIVEVPEGKADDIIAALREAKIKGKKVTVKLDRGRKG